MSIRSVGRKMKKSQKSQKSSVRAKSTTKKNRIARGSVHSFDSQRDAKENLHELFKKNKNTDDDMIGTVFEKSAKRFEQILKAYGDSKCHKHGWFGCWGKCTYKYAFMTCVPKPLSRLNSDDAFYYIIAADKKLVNSLYHATAELMSDIDERHNARMKIRDVMGKSDFRLLEEKGVSGLVEVLVREKRRNASPTRIIAKFAMGILVTGLMVTNDFVHLLIYVWKVITMLVGNYVIGRYILIPCFAGMGIAILARRYDNGILNFVMKYIGEGKLSQGIEMTRDTVDFVITHQRTILAVITIAIMIVLIKRIYYMGKNHMNGYVYMINKLFNSSRTKVARLGAKKTYGFYSALMETLNISEIVDY
jgi:hypothetical protein